MVPDHQDKIVQDQKAVNNNKAVINNNIVVQDQIVHQDKTDQDHNKTVLTTIMIMQW
jgi:hypothetical protein